MKYGFSPSFFTRAWYEILANIEIDSWNFTVWVGDDKIAVAYKSTTMGNAECLSKMSLIKTRIINYNFFSGQEHDTKYYTKYRCKWRIQLNEYPNTKTADLLMTASFWERSEDMFKENLTNTEPIQFWYFFYKSITRNIIAYRVIVIKSWKTNSVIAKRLVFKMLTFLGTALSLSLSLSRIGRRQ